MIGLIYNWQAIDYLSAPETFTKKKEQKKQEKDPALAHWNFKKGGCGEDIKNCKEKQFPMSLMNKYKRFTALQA